MEQPSIYISPEAVAEASAAARWYHERSYVAAKAFTSELDLIIKKITETPELFPAYVGGTRRALLHHFPFCVIYRKFLGRIEIIAIAHCKRRPGYWKNRLV